VTYSEHAAQIFDAGYSPLPIERGTKEGNLPSGFSGYDGVVASRADVQTWIEDRPDDNVAARLPYNVVGIDVDAYEGKAGAQTLEALCQKYGQLPSTWQVSSRFDSGYDGFSGILLFRIPIEGFADKAHVRDAGWNSGWEHVDVIRFGHRFVVAPGSTHNSRGTKYQVKDESSQTLSEQMPRVDELPMLPTAWCMALLQGDAGRTRRDKTESQWWTVGKSCPAVSRRLGQSLSELETGRHDNCRDNLLALTRLGEQGHKGVREAVDQLHANFIMQVTSDGDGKRTPDKARKEWQGLVAGLDSKIESKGLTSQGDRGCCSMPLPEWDTGKGIEAEPAQAPAADGLPTQPAAPTFSTIAFNTISPKEVEWLIHGTIPKAEPVIFIGEESIGKGLYWCRLAAQVTTSTNPIDVLIIVSEDDPERAVRPRLEAAGADLTRCHLMVRDIETMTGVPIIPGQSDEVAQIIEDTGAGLVIIDPWLSVVPSGLQVKDTQQARQALDPVTKLARRTGATFLLVTHTNRLVSDSARSMYGATVALRQVGRVCLMALQDPNDETIMYVGIEKSNIVGKSHAIKYHKNGDGSYWKITDTGEATGLSINELLSTFARDNDERTTDKWTQIALTAGANGGMITRSQILAAYEDNAKAADKAIARWRNIDPPRLIGVTGHHGIYEVMSASDHSNPPSLHHKTTGGMGGSSSLPVIEPPVPPVKAMGGSGGLLSFDLPERNELHAIAN